MTFSNPIVGAFGRLIRAAIQSVNYVAGSAGWRIQQTGEAEFSQLTARGTITAGDGLGVYNADGSFVRMNVIPGIGAAFETGPPNFTGIGYNPGQVYSQQIGGGSSQPQLVVQSPNINSPSVKLPSQIIMQGQGAAGEASHIDLSADGFSMKGSFGLPLYQAGLATIVIAATDTSKDSATINLPIPFPSSTSNIFLRMSNTSAASYGWHVRAISVSSTSFVIRCMGPAPGGTGFTASVQWSAFGF